MSSLVWALVFISLEKGVWQPEAGTLNTYPTMDACFVARDIAMDKLRIQATQAVCIQVPARKA